MWKQESHLAKISPKPESYLAQISPTQESYLAQISPKQESHLAQISCVCVYFCHSRTCSDRGYRRRTCLRSTARLSPVYVGNSFGK